MEEAERNNAKNTEYQEKREKKCNRAGPGHAKRLAIYANM
jgi:hypothetical protein